MKLFESITSATTLLTPNRRLSAIILKKYDQWQLQAGKKTWKTLDVIPLYPSWLERLWRHHVASHLRDHHILLTSKQEQVLWEKILRESSENDGLLQLSETAKLAKSAWEILSRWQVKLIDEETFTWHGSNADTLAFLNWAKKFETLCKKNNWLSPASLADSLTKLIAENEISLPEKIILIGFTEIAPQYEFLLSTCQKSGTEILRYEFEDNNQSSHHIGLMDRETEIRSMAQWASSILSKQETKPFIGCIIPDLESCREQVIRIFSESLKENEFNISAGKSLIAYPVIYDALAFLNMLYHPFTENKLIHLLRSPFVAAAESEKNQRAITEIYLHKKNVSTLTLSEALPLLSHCPLLTNILNKINIILNYNKTDAWTEIFCQHLTDIGWPGERSLNSHEYQVVQHAWLPLLNEFAGLSRFLGPISAKDALHYLNLIASQVMFQPESPEAPVQILGLLEAADIPFDYSWIMGLEDTTWPPRPKPNPFIPLALQKKLNMPNASAERELIYCQTLTQQLKRSSKHIIFSYPQQQDDMEFRPSSLIKSFANLSLNDLKLNEVPQITKNVYHTSHLEEVADNLAPIISETEKIQGGIRIFKSQAECGFKAFAEMRLHTRNENKNRHGLNKLDQGNAIHQALQLIWQELQTSGQLHHKTDEELEQLILKATEIALQNQGIDNRYILLESKRMQKLLWQWLKIEKNRPPFTVVGLEKEMTAMIGKLSATFRIDRVDEIITESNEIKQLIIDYKTGNKIDAKHWFGERLEEPQLPIYSIIHSEIPIGIAFAKINAEEMKYLGASQSDVKIPSINILSKIKYSDAPVWETQIEKWRGYLFQLSEDFYHGHAYVNPKHKEICDRCGLQSLCRVIHQL